MHDGAVDHQVVVDELGGSGAVGHDAADRACDQVHVLRAIGAEPVVHRCLVAEIELVSSREEDVLVSTRLEATDNGRADEASVAGYEDSGVGGNR